MSAYSTPSPLVRATSLPANACVCSGARTRWRESGRRICLQAVRIHRARLPDDETECVAGAHVDRTEVEVPPPRAPERERNLALRRDEPERLPRVAVHDLDRLRKLEHELESVDRSLRAHEQAAVHLCALERPLRVELELDLHSGIPSEHRSEREQQCERECEHRELGAPGRQRRNQSDRCERGEARDSRAPRPPHERSAATTSSARGVGTAPSTSRTTSSADTRCTHSSGRRTSRCASAGTATALTSSGST